MTVLGIRRPMAAVAAFLLAIGLSIGAAQPAGAGTSGAIYDMSRMLTASHPLIASAPQPALEPVRSFAPAPHPALLSAAAVEPAAATDPAAATPVQPMALSGHKLAAGDMASQPAGTVHSRGSQSSGALGGLLSEVRAGVFAHDRGPFGHDKEGGVDGNLEFLFTSPDILDIIWAPRPTLGSTVNSQGDTSQAYLGLTWEWSFWQGAFVDFSFGGALHNGERKEVLPDKKALGCALLFREGLDIGWRFAGGHSLMAHLDHISNASLCDKNEGLDNLGVRYGYQF